MEGTQAGTLYKLSISPVPPTSESDSPPAPKLTSPSADQSSSTALTVTNSRDATLVLWHNRMGHVNVQTIKNMSTHNSVKDLPPLDHSKLLHVCSGCALGKQHKATYPSNVQKERSKVPGELLHADLCGKMSTPSLGGASYYILIKDDCTSFRFVAFLKAKSDAIRFFIKVIRSVERLTGNSVQILRTDRGKEFCNNAFNSLLENEGISRETSTAYTPQQNGYVERDNRTICEAARSMLHLHNLPLKLWAESIHTAVYLLNRTINTQVGLTTPYELWFKAKPSVSHYRTFGTLAYIFTDKTKRTKFQPKGSRVIFVGYSDTSKGWRFWDPLTDRITESSDVIFDETTAYSPSIFLPSPPSHDKGFSSSFTLAAPPLPVIPHPPPPPHQVNPLLNPVGVTSTSDSLPSNTVDSSSESPPPFPPSIPSTLPSSSNIPTEPIHRKYRSLTDIYMASSAPTLDHSAPVPTNSAPLPSPPASPPANPSSPVSSSHSSFANMLTSAETYREPATYTQATMSPQAQYWKTAMEREYDSLMDNHTWKLVPPPPGRTIVQCKWVYKIKYTSDGNIDKYKARLVAKGYSQIHGIDYTETFSPVIKHDSVRVLFAIAAVLRMHMRQFDIGTAYLNSDLTTRIYMRQPEGFVSTTHPSHVCLLLKSLYGLKQSGRLWNHTFDAFLKLYNLTTSDADSCVYYRLTPDNSVDLIVGIFFDDGIVCASTPADLDAVIDHLQSTFKVTHGPMDYYVGF